MATLDTTSTIDLTTAKVEDLSVELEKSMIEKKQIVLLDHRLVVVFVVIVFLFAAVFHWYWILLAYPVLHFIFWLVCRNDPDTLDVYFRYSRQSRIYVPRQGLKQKRNLRPEGFGRGTIC
jgi:type IV secretion system protein TrbD